MPAIFKYKSYRFFFYSNENIPLEPCHIHVRKDTSIAKFWVIPKVSLASSYGFSAVELRELANVIKRKKDLIEDKWNEYFSI